MTPKQTVTGADWAIEAGAALAARRVERERERLGAAEAEDGRRRIPVDELQRRFVATVEIIIAALDAFGTAAGITIEAAPPAASLLELRAGDELLRLTHVDDDALVVLVRGRSTSYEHTIDLTDSFSPTDTARAIAQEWMQRLAAAEDNNA